MLRIDISTLRVSELRSLLAKARARSQDALVEQIEAEIASRAGSRRAMAPLAPEVDEPEEVLPIDPGAAEFELSEADALAFEADDAAPIDFGAAPDDFVFQLPKADPPPARRWPIGLAIAGVLITGAAVAWGLNGAPVPQFGQAPPAKSVVVAAAPSPALRAMTVRTETPTPAEPDNPEPAPIETAKAEPDRPTRLDPCAAPPSPAERLLCSDLALNLLDHEMRDAYRHAVEAGADPAALRESQAEWRRERDPVADARTLAGLYDRRIRELNAAALPPP